MSENSQSWHRVVLKEFLASGRSAALYFSVPILRQALQELAGLQSSQIKFLFPVKAFNHPTVLAEAAAFLSGFDVSNKNELSAVQKLLRTDHVVWNSSPCNERLDVDFNDQADSQLPELTNLSLRVNPDFIQEKNRFGVASGRIKQLLLDHPEVQALHLHLSGIENTMGDYLEAFEAMKELLQGVERPLHLNFGGGFSKLTLAEISQLVAKASSLFKNHQLYFEPGRWITQQAGLAVGKILVVEEHRVTTSLSAICHLRWFSDECSIFLPQANGAAYEKETEFFGPTCYENDKIGAVKVNPQTIRPGQMIIIDNVSGYAVGWNHSFNGVPMADVVFLGG